MQKQIAAGVIAGALVIAGAGATLILPAIAAAADPAASPTTTTANPAPTGSTGTTTPSTTDADGDGRGHGGRGGPGRLDPDDLTAAAGALGMTEADLTTALSGGKTAAQVATDKGVALQKVIDAIVAADTAAIKAEVAAGTMTQAQADARIANLAAHVTDEINGIRGMDHDGMGRGGHGGHGGPGGLDADDLTAAAKALGMTEADLTTALSGGKTAAQVATDKGVALQKVIDAIVAADTAAIKAEVAAGTMTQAQADARIANLAAHVTDEVNAVRGPGDMGRGFDGMAPDASPAPTATTSG